MTSINPIYHERLDGDFLQQIYSDDYDFLLEIFNTFIEITPVELEYLQLKINEQDIEAVRNKAHTLKPTFRMVGIPGAEEKMTVIQHYADANDIERCKIECDLFIAFIEPYYAILQEQTSIIEKLKGRDIKNDNS